MTRLAYVDGRLRPLNEACVSVEDRGYQFADGIYEVCAVPNHTLYDWNAHIERLWANLTALSIAEPMSAQALTIVAKRLIAVNRVHNALLYIQVTRGVARRDHGFPKATRPILVMTVRPFNFAQRIAQQASGVAVITRHDERWARCDIKSTALLPNVLAKQAAREAGAFEAWLVDRDGYVTEGASTNAWIIDSSGTIVTRPLSPAILPGVMRQILIRLARANGLSVKERCFTPAEALGAREAFLTATTAPCLGVVHIDGQAVGNGRPGPITLRLGALLWADIERQTGYRAAAIG